ncbi:PC-esterase domain-containing protein 1B [Lemmus lemmus]
MPYLRTHEVQKLLHNKFVVVLGDSIQRAVYKDLVLLLQKDSLLSSSQLKSKGELSFEHDVLLEGGRWGRMHNGTHYREVRQFCSGHHLVRFYFLTRAYSPYVEDILHQLRCGQYTPDLVVMNSCLWDLSRYGRNFLSRYREDLERLFRRLDQVLPASCLLVWNTAMPVAEVVSGGFIQPDAPACPSRLREDVMEANFYSSAEAVRRGFDVLDLHFHFRHAGQHRLSDGVHWNERAHRYLSQLLLAHVADAWGVVLPAHNLVGRWLRDVPAQRQPDGADRRQPRDHHRRTIATVLRDLPLMLKTCQAAEKIPCPPLYPPSNSHFAEFPRGAGMSISGKTAQYIVSRGRAPSAESLPTTKTESQQPLTLPDTTVSHTDPIEGTVIDPPKRQGLHS